jgi:hypothetical protein
MKWRSVGAAFWLVFLAATTSALAATPTTTPAQTGAFPWKAGDNPPAVAGIALGDTAQHVREVLGKPGHVGKMGVADLFEYPRLGLQVISTTSDGVSIIRLRTPQAGEIDGIKVGDSADVVLSKWGTPSTGQDRTALFNAGVWTVSVKVAPTKPQIIDILLGWNTTKFTDFDPKKSQFFRPN